MGRSCKTGSDNKVDKVWITEGLKCFARMHPYTEGVNWVQGCHSGSHLIKPGNKLWVLDDKEWQ